MFKEGDIIKLKWYTIPCATYLVVEEWSNSYVYVMQGTNGKQRYLDDKFYVDDAFELYIPKGKEKFYLDI